MSKYYNALNAHAAELMPDICVKTAIVPLTGSLRSMLGQYDPLKDEVTKAEKIIDRLFSIYDTQMNLADPKTSRS